MSLLNTFHSQISGRGVRQTGTYPSLLQAPSSQHGKVRRCRWGISKRGIMNNEEELAQLLPTAICPSQLHFACLKQAWTKVKAKISLWSPEVLLSPWTGYIGLRLFEGWKRQEDYFLNIIIILEWSDKLSGLSAQILLHERAHRLGL